MQINIVKPFLPDWSEIRDAFAGCLETGMVTNNSRYVREFEDRLQFYFGSRLKPTVYCNGEQGLYHLIQAWKHKLGYGPHQSFEVLVPSFTFSGTINAIVQNNLKPVFCDVDETLVLDTGKLNLDSDEIKMVLPVGAYGNLPDIEILGRFADGNRLILLMDNAPAFGAKLRDQFPCDYGYSEMISLHATKIFTSMEGGLNIVNDEEIQDYLIRLRDYGQFEKQRGDIDMPGLNSKMQEISAIIGLKNLEKVEYILSQRAINAMKYIRYFAGLEQAGLLKTMKVREDVSCPYLYFPLILNEEATAFVAFMQTKKIAVRRYYTSNHTLTYYKGKYRHQDLSFTEEIKDRIVALPLHTLMTEEELDYLFTSIDMYFKL